MSINFHSVIIYSLLFSLFVYGVMSNDFGGFFGTLTGLLFIYFFLATSESRRVIRDNLMFKVEGDSKNG